MSASTDGMRMPFSRPFRTPSRLMAGHAVTASRRDSFPAHAGHAERAGEAVCHLPPKRLSVHIPELADCPAVLPGLRPLLPTKPASMKRTADRSLGQSSIAGAFRPAFLPLKCRDTMSALPHDNERGPSASAGGTNAGRQRAKTTGECPRALIATAISPSSILTASLLPG